MAPLLLRICQRVVRVLYSHKLERDEILTTDRTCVSHNYKYKYLSYKQNVVHLERTYFNYERIFLITAAAIFTILITRAVIC